VAEKQMKTERYIKLSLSSFIIQVSAMKNFLPLLAALLLLPAVSGFAQPYGNTNGTFSINANVLSALTLTKDYDLEFGNVFQTTTQHVAVTGTPTYTAGTTPRAAKISISGAASREVQISFSNHTALNGNGTLDVTYAANDAEFVSGSSNPIGNSGWNPTSASATGSLDTGGDGAVFLGGSVAPTTSHTGSYTATATITVGYTGL
jgi:hypothetical protein